MKSFTSIIVKLGINPCVDVPEPVLRSLQKQSGKMKGPIAVCGTLNGKDFKQTVVKYQGAWRLYINGPMLKVTGLGVGDVAKVRVEFDPVSRLLPINPALATALSKNAKSREAFEKLSTSRQQEISRYLGMLKTKESLVRNVERVVRHLCGEKTDALHALMRTKAE